MYRLPIQAFAALVVCVLFSGAASQPGTNFPYPWAVLPVGPVTIGSDANSIWSGISCANPTIATDYGGEYITLSIQAASSNVGCGGSMNPASLHWPTITPAMLPYALSYRLFIRTVAGTVAGTDEVKMSQVAVHTFLRGSSAGNSPPSAIGPVTWQQCGNEICFEVMNPTNLATTGVWYNITAEVYDARTYRFFVEGLPTATTWYNSTDYDLGAPLLPPYWSVATLRVGAQVESRIGQVTLWSASPLVQCPSANSTEACTTSRWLQPGCVRAAASDKWNIPHPTCDSRHLKKSCLNVSPVSSATWIKLCPSADESPVPILADISDLNFIFDDWTTSFDGLSSAEMDDIRVWVTTNGSRGAFQTLNPSASSELASLIFPDLQAAYIANNQLFLGFWMNSLASSNKSLLNGEIGFARRSITFTPSAQLSLSTNGSISIKQANQVSAQLSSGQDGLIQGASIRYLASRDFEGPCVPGTVPPTTGTFDLISSNYTFGFVRFSNSMHSFNLTQLLESAASMPVESPVCVVADIFYTGGGAAGRVTAFKVSPALSISASSTRWMSRSSSFFDITGKGFDSSAAGSAKKRAGPPMSVAVRVTNATATLAPVPVTVNVLSDTAIRITFAQQPTPVGELQVEVESFGETLILPNYARVVADPVLTSNSSTYNQYLGALIPVYGNNFATENSSLNVLSLTLSGGSAPTVRLVSFSETLLVYEVISFGTNTNPALLQGQVTTYGFATSTSATLGVLTAPILPPTVSQPVPTASVATPVTSSSQPVADVPSTVAPSVVPTASSNNNSNINGGSPSTTNDSNTIGLAVGLSVGILLLIVGIIILALFLRKHQREQSKLNDKKKEEEMAETHYAPTPSPEHSKRDTLTTDLEKWMIPFSDLTLVKEVGRGSFGIVWRGKWRDQRVAIKESKLADPEKRKEFFAEAQLMLGLRPHRNVVQVLGVSYVRETDTYYIIMEFMASSLDKLVYTEDRTLSEQQMIKLAQGIASGVNHIGKEQIVHRDLAVRNILLSKEKNLVPKISDFGMSRAVADDGGGQTNTAIGPIAWMAPENINRQYSTKSDVWAFGCVLYEIATGHAPHYEQPDKLSLALEIRDGKHPTIPKSAPKEFQHLMGLCWQMNPDDRPSFTEILRYFRQQLKARKKAGEDIDWSSDEEADAPEGEWNKYRTV